MRSSHSWLAGTIVSGLLVVACAPAASPAPSAARPAVAGPSANPTTAAPAPTSGPSAQPPVVAGPPQLGWTHVTEARLGGRLDQLLSLDGGYFGWTREDFPLVWYSADGLDWVRSDMAKPVRPCPGWILRPDGEVLAAASNGDQAVLVGLEYDPDAAVCGTWRAAAWVSDDGTSWERAPGFGPEASGNVWTEDVWATPDGWEAVMKGVDRELRIWRSTDGLRWEPGEIVARGDGWLGVGAHASDSNGTRLLSVFDEATERSHLITSRDGEAWHELLGFPQTNGGVSRLLAPGATSPYWTAVTVDDAAERSTVWTSTDLEDWQDSPFPMPVVTALAHTPYGLLALGTDPCRDTGGPCPTDPPQYFISADGSSWTPLNAAVDAEAFVDGGAGVLGVDGFRAEGEPSFVWRLEPYSEDEAYLLDGLRDDAKFACAARRVDLPATAVAGVECSPGGDVVDRIGVYRFTTQTDLLDTYFSRLAGYGVELGSGLCPQRAGEGAYVPGDGPYRLGCYLNEFGNANYRFTAPDAFVYVGILGTGEGFEELHDWAWLGNLDTPGAPTVWRAPAR